MAGKRAEAAGRTGADILVVDDALETLELIERNLVARGHRVRTAQRAGEAMARLAERAADVVITDIRMPGRSGYDLIDDVRERHPDVDIIVVTGYATVEGAVRALRSGAWDYLAKPFTSEELVRAVEHVLDRRARRAGAVAEDVHGLVGRSPAMRALASSLAEAAGVRGAVLLCGESGSGRETVARALHALGRPEGPYQRLALDGPNPAAAASLAAAHGGVLHLAGFDDATEDARRAAIEAIGAAADVLVVVSTTLAAEPLARAGGAARDLVGLPARTIVLPPLRERAGDVTVLARHFLALAAAATGRPPRAPGEGAARALAAWSWPGNVRELRDLCLRLAYSGREGAIATDELPPAMRAFAARTLADVEREHVALALERAGGNKSRAAEMLGIDRKTLREKLRPAAPAGSGDAGGA